MKEEQNSYRQIFKATSLFGGVQLFNILIAIIKSKIIAVFIGPSGMGIISLFTTTTSLVGSLTNFGLGTSAVSIVASANSNGDSLQVGKVKTVLGRVVWLTGILGVLVMAIFSQIISQVTFGNKDFTVAIIWVSFSLLFNQLMVGQNVILQGLRHLNLLAKANIIGSSLGLFFSIPLYYYYNVNGIVPSILISSLISMLLSFYFSRRIKVELVSVSKREAINESKSMIKIGFLLSLSSLITLFISYLVRVFISNTGGLEEVGFYNAGFSIIGTYVSLIFTAMATDYYPRLSEVSHDNVKSKILINQQGEIALLLLSPILCIFLIFIKWAVILLYSNDFLKVNGMIQWAALGMYFKAASWSISFLFLAKRKTKLYFWNELFANLYILVLNILGYHFGGLDGLGISFLLSYILYLVQVYFVSKKNFNFNFSTNLVLIFSIQFSLGIISFFISKNLSSNLIYFIGIILIIISSVYSLKELDMRLDIKRILVKNILKM